MALPPDFPARVRAARAYAGVPSQKAFGKKTRMSGSTVKNYEGGESRPPDRSETETVKRLAGASGLPEWFFTVPNLKGALMSRAESDPVLSELRELRSESSKRYAALDAIMRSLVARFEGEQRPIRSPEDAEAFLDWVQDPESSEPQSGDDEDRPALGNGGGQ